MRSYDVQVKAKDGTMKSGTIMVPESLNELVTLVGEKVVYHRALAVYMAQAKRRIASGARPKRKLLHIDLGSLSPEGRAALVVAGVLQDD